ncbi:MULTISPECIES: macro domain-containing protein [unclassified Streptomyces]|uniref:macro domain-containing protein n=1 Tax=unclassified Streptomyces TaxID=2593676 RepID=UPI002E2E7164|nr:macro domain-containing protein [Streptomyces sp. NBC_01439]
MTGRTRFTARLVWGRRSLHVFCSHALAAFGLLAGLVQLVAALFSLTFSAPVAVIAATAAASVVWGAVQAFPPASAERAFDHPRTRVRVIAGDLFDQPGHLVIGFTDTFDTSVADDRVISRSSVQGQLLERFYSGVQDDLDNALTEALALHVPESVESRVDKPQGKLNRYPIGTVAIMPRGDRKLFGLAYSRLTNDLVAESSPERVWVSLCRLWESVYAHGHREPLTIPVIGSALGRIDTLSHENLLKMILLSFVAASRDRVITRELTVVVWPPDLKEINTLEIRQFLTTL